MKMKRFLLCAAAAAGLFLGAAAGEKRPFGAFREQAKKVVPNSPEDFRLGRELMKEIRRLAAKKTLADGKRHFYTEPVIYRSGKLYYSPKKWFDRNIFVSRDMWDGTPKEFQTASLIKSIELVRQAGFDGFSPLIGGGRAPIIYSQAAVQAARAGEKSSVVPVFWFGRNGLQPYHMEQIKACAEGPTWRFKGKPVAFSYNSDNYSPARVAAALKEVREKTGIDLAYVHGVGSLWGTGGDPFHNYIDHGEVSAVMILKCFDRLTAYLDAGEGIQFRNRLPDRDSNLFAPFYDEVLLPLYAAACAQDKFKSRKILGLSVQAGYSYYWGSQTLDRRGTKTLRTYLELCRKHNVDFIHGVEWDETNEDTCIDPTVCKPASSSRIYRYYSDLMRGNDPVPFPGDDLSLPNLIVSQRRQAILGAPFEVELLNVPDTKKSCPYTVEVRLFDEEGKCFFTSRKYEFDASRLADHTIVLPAEEIAPHRAVYPHLVIDFAGKKRVIDSGLPASVIRATVSRDYSWYCTPLRNLMFPAKEKVRFSREGFLAEPMVRKIAAEVELEFPGHKLNAVEALQNSMEIFAHDPKNEFLQNDPARRLFRISSLYMNRRGTDFGTLTLELANAPGACYFEPVRHKRNSYLAVANEKYRQIPWKEPIAKKRTRFSRHQNVTLFSVPENEVANAVLTVSGVRTSGPDEGRPFSWSLPLRELGAWGVRMKTFEDGLHFGVETACKPELLPLPLDSEKAAFKTVLANDLPEGVLMFRAVSKDGRVWWSKPFAPALPTGRPCRIGVYDPARAAFDLEVDALRVPRIVYKFDPALGPDVLSCDAGREFFGALGALGTIPSGFEGAAHSQNAVSFSAQLAQDLQKDRPSRPRPDWEKLPDGKWALRFAPGRGQFVTFPPTTVPQRAGYSISAEIKFDAPDDQLIFSQCGPGYLAGAQLRLENGKFVIDFKNRRPHDMKSRYSQTDTHKSALSPVPGEWNKVVLSYDGRGFTLAVNGKKEYFPQTGYALWLCVFTFGGTDPRDKKELKCFSGLLRSLEIRHTTE